MSSQEAPASPKPPRTPQVVRSPVASWDMHAHIIGPPKTQVSTRSFTAAKASAADYLAVLDQLGLDCGLIVQPTVHGRDHSILTNALQVHSTRLLGVAVIDTLMTGAELDALKDRGVVGARIFDILGDRAASRNFKWIGARCADLNWFLQLAGPGRIFLSLRPLLERVRVPMVIDHLGWIDVREGVSGNAFQCVRQLVRDYGAFVKLSAMNRLSQEGPPFVDIVPFARALIEAAPQRVLWGSDWPHIGLPGQKAETPTLLDFLAQCASPDEIEAILVDNPRALLARARTKIASHL